MEEPPKESTQSSLSLVVTGFDVFTLPDIET